MKETKCKIFINGVYLETLPNRNTAEMRVETYERMDRYEVEVEGTRTASPNTKLGRLKL